VKKNLNDLDKELEESVSEDENIDIKDDDELAEILAIS